MKQKKKEHLKVYAAVNVDESKQMSSSSGGVFRAFAEYVLENSGLVCGAVLRDNHVYHVISDQADDMTAMSGSKYVQSEISNKTYVRIQRALQEGRMVLFSGTPCQCSGLNNWLGKHEKLITMDFVCHGVPSPKVFDDYIHFLENEYDGPVQYLGFRYKSTKEMGIIESFQLKDGRIVRRQFYDSPYLTGFEMGLFTRTACYECPFAQEQRCSDVTVCDYWGIEKVHREFDPMKGVSGIVINTERGKKLVEACRDQLKLVPSDMQNLARDNHNLHMSTSVNPHRADFFQDRQQREFVNLIPSYMRFPGAWKWRLKALLPTGLKAAIKLKLKKAKVGK